MPDITVTRIDPAEPDQVAALLDLDQLVWSDSGRTPRAEALRDTPQRAGFLATRDGETVGVAGSWDVEVSIPAKGGAASLRPAEGLTWVGVHPDHRRTGVLSAVMRHHLRWTREEQGRSMSVLKASQETIYGRYGFGVASSALRSRFASGTTFVAPDAVREQARATTTRTVTASEDQAQRWHELARSCGEGAPGQVVRSLEDCARLLRDIPESRGDREPARLLWATRDGQDVGCAYFHRTPTWSDGQPEGSVGVTSLVATDPGARLALAERLTTIDLMSGTEYWVTPDDSLALWLPSLRAVGGGGLTDCLWLRLVDLPLAVAERGHATDLDVVVQVRDEALDDNAGTWRWTARDGVGELVRTDVAADLTLDIADLAGVWLGGQTLGARAAAGLVTEQRPGAVGELDAALRTPVGPITTMDF